MGKESRAERAQSQLPRIGGTIGYQAQDRARKRAGRPLKDRFPRRVTPLVLDWLRTPDARGYRRGLSGQTLTILSYLRHWTATRPDLQRRGPDGRTYLRVSIRQIARTIGRHRSQKNVWLCLRRLEALQIITRRRMRRRIPRGATVIRGNGREPLREGFVNGVGLIRFSAAGSKICEVSQLDALEQIKRARDCPAYSGPGAWGQLDAEAFVGSTLYELWRERFPGVLRRLQLCLDDFREAEAERLDWPGNAAGQPPSPAGAGPPG